MPDYIIKDTTLTAIADSIRAKTGTTNKISPADMPSAIEGITGGGGGSVEGYATVTFHYADHTGAKEFTRLVMIGDDCPDPYVQKRIETPTKESTVQYDYTCNGWSLVDGGSADSGALKNVTSDRVVYAAFSAAVKYYTITWYDDDGATVLKTEQVAYGTVPRYAPSKPDYAFEGWTPEPVAVTGDASYTAGWFVVSELAATSWENISKISANGTGANYFSVGDTKSVYLKGTVGTLSLDTTLYVYIIGFDHNKTYEGTGIHFGGFKSAPGVEGVDVCLVDEHYNGFAQNGAKYFNMNHVGGLTHGGWKRCDMRYDILGSTDVAPDGYGGAPASGQVGYDASTSCATDPVPNTLMSCLPEDLRSVMKPMIKYTNNVAGGTAAKSSHVTASIDYLPLLGQKEVTGGCANSISYEGNKQEQYAFYLRGGNTKQRKYKHTDSSTLANWWLRSPVDSDGGSYCLEYNEYNDSPQGLGKSFGLSPVFKV